MPETRTTVLSADRRYRYTLWRTWEPGAPPFALFIGLNPSTADERNDDPTIKRCVDFAQRWGFGSLCMMNLFAFRATEPAVMKAEAEPIGYQNDELMVKLAQRAGVVVAAWGTEGKHLGRDRQVLAQLGPVMCLGTTKEGFPRHPLYVEAITPLVELPPRPERKKSR